MIDALFNTAAISDNDIKIGIALITGLLGLLVAVISALLTRRNNKELELLKFKLSGAAEEEKARRDYQYEARKRLYQQIEPLLFQLVEHGENAERRVYTLARTAKEGDLEPGAGWLSDEDKYFMNSTLYRFLAPLVIVKLIQNQLTLVDLTVDPLVHKQYLLAKILLWSFKDDFVLAKITDPPLLYDPHHVDSLNKRNQDAAQYWKQGIPTGQLDNLLAALTTTDNNDTLRCMTYGEFEKLVQDLNSPTDEAFVRMLELFVDFHPRTRPVLWRILITQAYIYRTLIGISEAKTLSPGSSDEMLKVPLNDMAHLDKKRFDWRQTPDEASAAKVLEEPFEAAERYLYDRLKGFGLPQPSPPPSK